MRTRTDSKTYRLPDENVISVGDERFRCGEILFNPTEIGLANETGLHYLITKSINSISSDLGIRSEMWSNIVTAGGKCCFSAKWELRFLRFNT